MVDETELRSQMHEAFGEADYPLESPMALLPTLPDGVGTRFESGEFSMSVVELQTELEPAFPYESPDEMVDHIIQELKANDIL